MLFSRSSFIATLIALVALRMVIGLHFFSEGLEKIRSGSFDATGFLMNAQGPAAPFFQGLTDDPHRHIRLNVVEGRVDPQRTIAIWDDWALNLSNQQGHDAAKRQQVAEVLNKARTDLLQFHTDWRLEIAAWLQGQHRLDGFERDGRGQSAVAREVASLAQQVDRIDRERQQSAGEWFGTLDAIWDNFEAGANAVAPDQPFVSLSRPWVGHNSPIRWINRVLPWFDLTVGMLLVAGLFTRLAALAGAGLLLGVVATQPFWIPGVENTWYQWIEWCGLLLVLVTGAGRFAGLDYFFQRRRDLPASAETES